MGAFLEKPKIDKSNDGGEGFGLRYAVSSMQGWRVEMEDSHCAKIGLGCGKETWAFFAVFDGHAGGKVAMHCSDHLLEAFLLSEEMQQYNDKIVAFNSSSKEPTMQEREELAQLVSMGIKSGFLNLDQKMKQIPELFGNQERSGSTAVCLLITPTHLYFANLGDSRGVLSRDKQTHFFTEDHKPFQPRERQRILNAGGSVMIQRVNGSLAVSRALGDYEYKSVSGLPPTQQLVSPEPDITIIERSDKDEFAVLACDGVFDVITNQEIVDFIRQRLTVTENLSEISNCVLDACLSKGSRDNMSLILIAFSGAPSVQPKAQKQYEELEKDLDTRIRKLVSLWEEDDIDVSCILRVLSNQDIPGTPLGAGWHAMRQKIEDIVDKIRQEKEPEVSVANSATPSVSSEHMEIQNGQSSTETQSHKIASDSASSSSSSTPEAVVESSSKSSASQSASNSASVSPSRAITTANPFTSSSTASSESANSLKSDSIRDISSPSSSRAASL